MNLAILIFINLIYAGSSTFLKIAAAEFPPETLVWLRHTIALMTLLPFAVLSKWPRMTMATVGRIALATVLAFTLTSLLQVVGIQYSSASVGALVVAIQPLMTIAMASIFLHEHLHFRVWAACVLALMGLAVLSGDNLLQLQGNLFFVVAIACESSLGIFLRPLLRGHPPLQISIVCLAFASLFLLPFQIRDLAAIQRASLAAWSGVLYLGIGCSALGTVLWLISLRTLEVSRVAIAWFLQPLWGSILPVFVLGESMSAGVIVGGGLIMVAMGLTLMNGHTSPGPTQRLAPRY